MSLIGRRPKSIRAPTTRMSFFDSRPAWRLDHLHAGFAQFHQQVMPIRMAQAVLQLHGQNHLTHPQIHLLQVQEDHELIKRLKKSFMLFGPGARGAHLSGVITPDGTPVGASSVMALACLRKRISEGCQTLIPRNDGALSALKFPLLGKVLVLQLDDHCQGWNRGTTPVNKQRLISRCRNGPR
jgi:hypothetical protein